jgi:photosystem II stability/assembly factor-like uncharacterized protein
MPTALDNEGAFAASGTCLVTEGNSRAWFATGGGAAARVFRTSDQGHSWTTHETPITARSASAGVFSLAFRDAKHGVAVGGNYAKPDVPGIRAAQTSDGGVTWQASQEFPPKAYRSGVARLVVQNTSALIAVGPTGTDISYDAGARWSPFSDTGFHAISVAKDGTLAWASGDKGVVANTNALVLP